MGHAIISLYARLIGIATPVEFLGFNIDLNSEEDLTKDLNDDPIISQTMGHFLSEICYKYGVYLSPNKNVYIIKDVDNYRTNASTNASEQPGKIPNSDDDKS